MSNKQWLTENFLKHRKALLGYITGLVYCPSEAEDVVQDTWLRMVQGEAYPPISFPKAYIFRIGRNIALDRLRKRKRAQNATTKMSAEPDVLLFDLGPESVLIEDEERQLLSEAVSLLPLRCQQVYTLRTRQGLSHHAIADQLDISVRTVENHIARATRNCRQHVAGRQRPSETRAAYI